MSTFCTSFCGDFLSLHHFSIANLHQNPQNSRSSNLQSIRPSDVLPPSTLVQTQYPTSSSYFVASSGCLDLHHSFPPKPASIAHQVASSSSLPPSDCPYRASGVDPRNLNPTRVHLNLGYRSCVCLVRSLLSVPRTRVSQSMVMDTGSWPLEYSPDYRTCDSININSV